MSSQTPNLDLVLPVGTEKVSRQIINDNNTKIDTAVGSNSDAIANLSGYDKTAWIGNVTSIDTLNALIKPGRYNYYLAISGLKSGWALIDVGALNGYDNYFQTLTYADGTVLIRHHATGGTWTNWQELAKNTDTGWSLVNSTYPLYLRIKNEVAYIDLRLNGGTTPPDGTTLYTLASGLRPSHEIAVPTQNLRANLFVKTTGEISINANSGQTLNNYMAASISFPIA